jgi:hypothetical protein
MQNPSPKKRDLSLLRFAPTTRLSLRRGAAYPKGKARHALLLPLLGTTQTARDDRWRNRFASIPELVASAAGKYAAAVGHRRALAKLAAQMIRDRRPAAELRAAVLAAAEARRIEGTRAESTMPWAAGRELTHRRVAHG